MGRSFPLKYRVEIFGDNNRKGTFGWQVSEYGKANEKNLARFVSKISPQVNRANIVEQKTGNVVANWNRV